MSERRFRPSAAEHAQEAARELYDALLGIYIEELNGRLCALPDTLPGFDDDIDDAPRESRCCRSCQRHWERTKAALRRYEAEIEPARNALTGAYMEEPAS